MKKVFPLAFLLVLLCSAGLYAQGGPQLYNMSFDTWSKSGGAWYLYAKDAPASQRIWDSANTGMSKVGMSSMTPEYEHLAVPGPGKAAARIESRKVAWAFIAGNIYNGRFVRAVDLSGVETELGAPFKARPKALRGYYHYVPKRINYAKAPREDMKGKMDEAVVEVILTDWSKPYRQISNKDGFIDADTDPHVIGKATKVIKKGTSGYVAFEVPFEYRSGKTPSYVSFTISASRFGDSQTGASGSVLYVDEFEFVY